MHPDFFKYDPIRLPSWRHDEVLALFEDGPGRRRPGRWADSYIRGYWAFLRKYRSTYGIAPREVGRLSSGPADEPISDELYVKYAGLWYARRYYEQAGIGGRSLIEAALLARERYSTIARRLKTTPSMVRWYQALFFHVRDRFQSPGWIRIAAIGTLFGKDFPPRDDASRALQLGKFLKAAAYHGGSTALDAVWNALFGIDYSNLDESIGLKVKANCLKLLLCEPFDPKQLPRLLRACLSKSRRAPRVKSRQPELPEGVGEAIEAIGLGLM